MWHVIEKHCYVINVNIHIDRNVKFTSSTYKCKLVIVVQKITHLEGYHAICMHTISFHFSSI